MSIIRVPNQLRHLTGGKSKIEIKGASIDEIITNLEVTHPGARRHLLTNKGELKSFINIFVNGIDIHALHGKETPISDDAEVEIVTAMAGG